MTVIGKASRSRITSALMLRQAKNKLQELLTLQLMNIERNGVQTKAMYGCTELCPIYSPSIIPSPCN